MEPTRRTLFSLVAGGLAALGLARPSPGGSRSAPPSSTVAPGGGGAPHSEGWLIEHLRGLVGGERLRRTEASTRVDRTWDPVRRQHTTWTEQEIPILHEIRLHPLLYRRLGWEMAKAGQASERLMLPVMLGEERAKVVGRGRAWSYGADFVPRPEEFLGARVMETDAYRWDIREWDEHPIGELGHDSLRWLLAPELVWEARLKNGQVADPYPGWSPARVGDTGNGENPLEWVFPPAREDYRGPVVKTGGQWREDWASPLHSRGMPA